MTSTTETDVPTAILSASPLPPVTEDGWRDISTAPRTRPIIVKTAAGRIVKARWVCLDDDNAGWGTPEEDDPRPNCWDDGFCWASNSDEQPSDPPVAWIEMPGASPLPTAVEAGTGTKEDWWDAAALAISEDILGRRYENIDALPVSEAETLFGIVAAVEAAMINTGAQPGNALEDALSAAVEAETERCAKIAETFEGYTSSVPGQYVNGNENAKRCIAAAIRSGHGGGA